MTGTASATLIQPITIAATAPLRFGLMAQPTAAGTVTVSTTGAVSTSGGMVGNTAIAQGGAGPQAGRPPLWPGAWPGAWPGVASTQVPSESQAHDIRSQAHDTRIYTLQV